MILTFHVAHYLEGTDYVIHDVCVSIVCNPEKFRKIEKMRNPHDEIRPIIRLFPFDL